MTGTKALVFAIIILTLLFVVPLFAAWISKKTNIGEGKISIGARILGFLALVGLLVASFRAATGKEPAEVEVDDDKLLDTLTFDALESNQVFNKASKQAQAVEQKLKEEHEQTIKNTDSNGFSQSISDYINDNKG